MTDLAELEYPVVSANCLKAIDMITSGDTDILQLQKVISQDAMLSLAVIRLGNSPMHRRQSEIEDVNTAINILGTTNVLNALVMETIRGYSENGGKTSERIIQHGAVISALSHFIADKSFKQAKSSMELLGILHDLPSLVLCHNFRPEYRELMKNIVRLEQPLEKLELEIFGISRQDIMQRCVEEFHLSENMTQALMLYSEGTELEAANTKADKYVSILRLAHYMESKVASDQIRMHDSTPDAEEQLIANLDLKKPDYEEMLENCASVVSEHTSKVA